MEIWDSFWSIKKFDPILNKHISFTAQGGYVHEIFKINKIWQDGMKK